MNNNKRVFKSQKHRVYNYPYGKQIYLTAGNNADNPGSS